MRRTWMMTGILAALLTSSAGLALANGRTAVGVDWRSNDANCAPGTTVGVRFDSGWNRSGYGWRNDHRGQFDRRGDDRNDRRFGTWNDRRFGGDRDGSRGQSGYGYGDRDGSRGQGGNGYGDPSGGYGGHGGGYGDHRNPSHDGRGGDGRSPTPMPDRSW